MNLTRTGFRRKIDLKFIIYKHKKSHPNWVALKKQKNN
jgi:hypothetical protein